MYVAMQIKSLNAEQQCDYAETEGYNNVNVQVCDVKKFLNFNNINKL